jgi:hypothetical protein
VRGSWNTVQATLVLNGMRTLEEIREEIDALSERRIEVMRGLSEGFDTTSRLPSSGKSSGQSARCFASATVT